MALPAEKISELKQIIHNHLSQMDIQKSIQQVLSDSLQGEAAFNQQSQFNEQDVLEMLRQQGVIDNVMQKLHIEQGQHIPGGKQAARFIDKDDHLTTSTPLKKTNIDPSRRYLYLQVLGGKAFLEHLQEPQPLPGQVSSTFTVHINFRSQRFKSKPTPCACDPNIQEGFLLEIHKDSSGDAGRMLDSTGMLSVCDPVHIVLIKTDFNGDTHLVSSHFLEWRVVLSQPQGRLGTSIELLGVGTECKVPVGLLDIKLELLPKTIEAISGQVLTAQFSMEKNKQSERERLFLVYAKQWWREFLQIRPTHSERLVKIFAQDENGINRPVCSYIKPLRAGRLLDTPREAARFVSLIGYERVPMLGGGDRAEQWSTTHAFFCRNKGDCEDHAILLCSLLLGFGLDAYVCVGTKSKAAPHAWVTTIGADGLVTFWETLTGNRYIHKAVNPDDPPLDKQHRPRYPYQTLGCVFNHTSFYANTQGTDTIGACQLDLHNQSHWKAMSADAIRSVCGMGNIPTWPTLPPLCASNLDSALLSNDLEVELRALVDQHRADQGLNTTWDDQLSYLLTPALASYETERITGISAGNEEFQQAIRIAVPEGHTFKGYPVQFVHRNARKAFAACLKSPVCEEIIDCRGDLIRLAVRVRVFTYPESACATWIMFACKYKSIL
ncbi:unnamed protein product [Owenia fusiformis]|uniref:Centrosomal protein of 76 kDa n=1 Tax=Owenia fusiformis TaxID=6347 RepID=A0A8S4NFD3_OWEFU|nr:unnamed protein product [Owenia fusiformis]